MFKLGQIVQQEEGETVMQVIDLEKEDGKNVITQWQDELGNTLIGKFAEEDLTVITTESN